MSRWTDLARQIARASGEVEDVVRGASRSLNNAYDDLNANQLSAVRLEYQTLRDAARPGSREHQIYDELARGVDDFASRRGIDIPDVPTTRVRLPDPPVIQLRGSTRGSLGLEEDAGRGARARPRTPVDEVWLDGGGTLGPRRTGTGDDQVPYYTQREYENMGGGRDPANAQAYRDGDIVVVPGTRAEMAGQESQRVTADLQARSTAMQVQGQAIKNWTLPVAAGVGLLIFGGTAVNLTQALESGAQSRSGQNEQTLEVIGRSQAAPAGLALNVPLVIEQFDQANDPFVTGDLQQLAAITGASVEDLRVAVKGAFEAAVDRQGVGPELDATEYPTFADEFERQLQQRLQGVSGLDNANGFDEVGFSMAYLSNRDSFNVSVQGAGGQPPQTVQVTPLMASVRAALQPGE